MSTIMLMCPSCKQLEPIKKYEKYEHNGVFYIPCSKCSKLEYFEVITFLRKCFFCGSKEGIVEHPYVDPNDGEWTGRKFYLCHNCGAKEGDQKKAKR